MVYLFIYFCHIKKKKDEENNKLTEKQRLQEELNNDFNNKRPIETNEEIENFEGSFISQG